MRLLTKVGRYIRIARIWSRRDEWRLLEASALFDCEHYRRQAPVGLGPNDDPIAHYLTRGAEQGVDPNPLFDTKWYLAEYADAAASGLSPFAHYLSAGAAAGHSPHPLFDTVWYLSRHPDVAGAAIQPLAHFLAAGLREMRDPNPLFDTKWYLATYPDVVSRGINPLVDYLARGAADRRMPNPLFNPEWYLQQYPDVVTSGLDPLAHYLCHGAAEGRDPNPLFDTSWYARRYPDIAETGANPLADYLARTAEGRAPNPLFDTSWYLEQYPDVAASGLNPLAHYLARGAGEGRDPNPLFDTDWYFRQYPDVAASGANPLADYLARGIAEERNPNPLFDTSWYLKQYKDVAASGLNPLAHYLADGGAGGRDPNPLFNTDWYLKQYPSVAASGLNPLADYLTEGAAAGRDPNPLFDTDWYFHEYPDVVASAINPLADYLAAPDRNPNSLFDRSWYRRQYAQRLADATDPLADFLRHGASKGTRPNPLFDPQYYLRVYADVASSGSDPLAHYRDFGARERRDPSAEFDTELYLSQLAPAERTTYPSALEHYFKEGAQRGLRHNQIYDRQHDPEPIEDFRAGLRADRPAILMVCHSHGGGTQKNARDLACFARASFNTLLLTPRPGGRVRLTQLEPERGGVLDFDPSRQLSDLAAFLDECRVERVHVHHEDGHEHYLHRLIERLGVAYDVTLHDYFALAPQPHLTDSDGRFVGEDLYAAEAKLIAAADRPVSSLREWQAERRPLLTKARRVIAPSADVKRRYKAYFSEIRITVAPHLDQPLYPRPIAGQRPAGDEALRVAVLGALSPEKGYRIVLDCASRARRNALPLAFTLIGYSLEDERLAEAGVTITGRYRDAELHEIIEQAGPGAIWFPALCPETYCYTLTTALRTGLPLIVPNLGAFPERVRGYDNVQIESWEHSAARWIRVFLELRDSLVKRPMLTQHGGARFYKDDYLTPRAIGDASVSDATPIRSTTRSSGRRQPGNR